MGEVSFTELINEGFTRIVRELGFEAAMNQDFNARLTEIIGTRVNEKADIKRQIMRQPLPNREELEQLERTVLERCRLPAGG